MSKNEIITAIAKIIAAKTGLDLRRAKASVRRLYGRETETQLASRLANLS